MEQQEITVCAAIIISGPLVYHLIRWNVGFSTASALLPFTGDANRFSLLAAYWRWSSYQGDMITAIPVGQSSWILWPSRLPYLGPLSSQPAAMKGPLRKRNLGLQLGTVFAQRGVPAVLEQKTSVRCKC